MLWKEGESLFIYAQESLALHSAGDWKQSVKKSITEVDFRHSHSPGGSSAGEYPSVMAGTLDTVRGIWGHRQRSPCSQYSRKNRKLCRITSPKSSGKCDCMAKLLALGVVSPKGYIKQCSWLYLEQFSLLP